MRTFLRRNGLSVAALGLFLLFWAAQALTGFSEYNDQLREHGHRALSPGEYLHSGDFWESTGENWESEFFQMAAFVLLTAFLYQKGSAESNTLPEEGGEEEEKTAASGDPPPWPVRRGGLALRFYAHSLSLALGLLFLLSFVIHLLGGTAAHNVQEALHGGEAMTPLAFLGSAEFWSQSFENWQSEFLSVGAMVLLTIRLRERNSAESKDLEAPHSKTGK